MEHKSKWWTKMIAKYGSEEAVREFMRQAQKKSRENYKGTGGCKNDPETARMLGYKSAEKRWGYREQRNNKTKEES